MDIVHENIVSAEGERSAIAGHGLHGLRRLAFKQHGRIRECCVGRECVEDVENGSLSLDAVGCGANGEHHVRRAMLLAHCVVDVGAIDKCQPWVVRDVRGYYRWANI